MTNRIDIPAVATAPSRRAAKDLMGAAGLFGVAAALAVGPQLPAWAFMWLLAASVYATMKWLTWRRAVARFGPAPLGRALAYLLAWPGMDPIPFLRPADGSVAGPTARDWSVAAARTLCGVALLWGVVRLVPPGHPLLRGWVGMVGLVLVLHFGVFQLLALAWRRHGVHVRPLMNAPLRATSVAGFWGGRWNTGFRQLAHDLVFRPLRRHLGVTGATLAAFAASGLVHDLVISVPAGAGLGLPTAYFLLQGAAVVMERSALGRRIGLGRGAAGWAFTFLVTAGPAFWLLHPPFVRDVVVPFLAAIGATRGITMGFTLERALFACGLLHLGILIASALVPTVLDWRGELAKLRALSRRLVWVHGAFIVLVIVGFGVLSLALAGSLADGTPLARAVCGFVAVFWLARLGIQFFVFDATPFLTHWLLKLGYHGLTVAFTVLVLVYGWAAVAPAR